jgi:hypothetical protein
MAKAAAPSTTVLFSLEKETKNTVRFAEQVADGALPVIGTIYVRKGALPEGTEHVAVTVAPAAV